MPSKNLRRRTQKAREAEFSVKICGATSLRPLIGHALLALLILAAGVNCLINQRFLLATLFFLWCAAQVETFRGLKSEIGEKVLAFTEDGLKYRDRFFEWDNIRNAKIRGDGIEVLSCDKQLMHIRPGLYEWTMEELLSEIEMRIRS